MDTIRSVIEPYHQAIIDEADRWLIEGRPIPFFFLFAADVDVPEKFRSFSDRFIKPSGTEGTLVALDYLLAKREVGKALADHVEKLQDGPAKRVASVLVGLNGSPEIATVELPYNGRSFEKIDEQKITDLCVLLESFALAAVRERGKRQPLENSLKASAETVLTRLLQRAPTLVEIGQIFECLKAQEL